MEPNGWKPGNWDEWGYFVLKNIEELKQESKEIREKQAKLELESIQSKLKWRGVWVMGAILVQIGIQLVAKFT